MLSPRVYFIILLFFLTGCDDLDPSSEDKRPPVDTTTIGPAVGQIAPDFSLFDTLGNPITMSAELTSAQGVVLYYTMWCPICDSHMSHMRSQIIPDFPNVKFFIIDYVSGTIELSREAQLSNGYADLNVLVDNIQEVLTLYQATMGTTVVIDNAGTVRMNEDYKDGIKLTETLTALQ
jgi:peroxiredoxin